MLAHPINEEAVEKVTIINNSAKALALLQTELTSLLSQGYNRDLSAIFKTLDASRISLNNIVLRKKKNIDEFEMDVGKIVLVDERMGFQDTLHVRIELRKNLPSASKKDD